MKLFYFAVKGRAETARLILNLSGVKFEDVTFGFEEWNDKYKSLAPAGSAPWLELDDGSVLTQGSAITMYVAHLAGFQPRDPLHIARTIELTNILEDVYQACIPSMSIKDVEERMVARKALTQPDGGVGVKLNTVEKIITDLKTEYYCGDQPTLADYHLFAWLGYVRTGFLDGITLEYMESFKNTNALRSKLASLPKVKELYGTVQGFEP